MSKEVMRIPIRFNLEVPEHARLVSVLRNLNKTRYSTMSSFIIEALTYYVRVLANDPEEGKDFRIGSERAFVTKQELDLRLSSFEKEMRLYLFESIVPLILGGAGGTGSGQVTSDMGKTVDQHDETVDLAGDPEIMKSISSWIE